MQHSHNTVAIVSVWPARGEIIGEEKDACTRHCGLVLSGIFIWMCNMCKMAYEWRDLLCRLIDLQPGV